VIKATVRPKSQRSSVIASSHASTTSSHLRRLLELVLLPLLATPPVLLDPSALLPLLVGYCPRYERPEDNSDSFGTVASHIASGTGSSTASDAAATSSPTGAANSNTVQLAGLGVAGLFMAIFAL
jgi:hypothetical protein